MKKELEPSPRTLRLLMSWEKKYGLDEVRRHLDEGLFSRDKEQQRLSYLWLHQRRIARRNNAVLQAVLGAVLVIGVTAYLV